MLPDVLLSRGLAAALGIVDESRRQIQRLARNLPTVSPGKLLDSARIVIARHEPLLARTLRDSLLLAWLDAAHAPAVEAIAPVRGIGGGRRPPWRTLVAGGDEEPESVVRFPQIERAARDLAERRVLLPADFDRLDQDARRTAFTVARINSLESLQRIQKALTEDVEHGGTLKNFRKEASEAIGDALTPGGVETVYRTQVAQAYSAGQHAVLDHPMVADEFPYLLWTAVHDSRVRPEHLAMEKHGQNGTAVYRSDDPMWVTLFPPAAWNCRCHAIPLSLADAASYGSREARRWLQTGVPPISPVHAARPYPIIPPPGWPTSARIGSVP